MKKTTNFTYSVSGTDGRTESRLSLEEVKQRVADGRITGSTIIQRSDSEQWSTAADFPEIGVKDVVVSPFDDEAGPDALTRAIETSRFSWSVRRGAGWFFWISALSFINSIFAYIGTQWGYALGLSVTYQIGEIGVAFGSKGKMLALGVNLFASLLYLFFGITGWQNFFTPYLLGMFLYAGDTLVACVSQDWLSAGVHFVALIFMALGLQAHMERREMAWTPGLILKGTLCFLLIGGGGWALTTLNPGLHKLDPELWVKQPQNKWPDVVLTHNSEFRGHSTLQGASAFLIELPGKRVVAATAKHLIGPDGGVEPALRTTEVNDSIVKWNLHTRARPDATVAVTGLFGAPDHYGALDDWLLLDVDKKATKLPASPLKVRYKPLSRGDKVFIVGVRYENDKNTQEVFSGKVTNPSYGIIEGTLDTPANLEGFSGAPILDTDGHIVGLLTGTRSQPDAQGRYATFAGHGVDEVARLLRDGE